MIRRGEIWWAALPPPDGSEPGYKRPVLVVQADEFNASRIKTIVAAVITSNLRLADAPGNILLSAKHSKLPKESVVNVSQIITIDKSFLTERVHSLPDRIVAQIDEGLRLALRL